MINESKFTETEDGGIKILLESESFEAESLPMNDRIGGLLQIKVDNKWIRTEVELPLPLVKKDAQTTPSSSPLLEVVNTERKGTDASVQNKEDGLTGNNTAKDNTDKKSDMAEPEQISIAYALLLAFAGGLLLNIMPCVLPVLIMKLFGLVKQTDITPTQQRVAGIAYSGGIVISFLVLALVVVVLQSSFGLQVN